MSTLKDLFDNYKHLNNVDDFTETPGDTQTLSQLGELSTLDTLGYVYVNGERIYKEQ